MCIIAKKVTSNHRNYCLMVWTMRAHSDTSSQWQLIFSTSKPMQDPKLPLYSFQTRNSIWLFHALNFLHALMLCQKKKKKAVRMDCMLLLCGSDSFILTILLHWQNSAKAHPLCVWLAIKTIMDWRGSKVTGQDGALGYFRNTTGSAYCWLTLQPDISGVVPTTRPTRGS